MLGPVFRTYEPARDRLAAVKVFRLDLTPEQARNLADELQRIIEAGLTHPSIVGPLAAGVEGTTPYLASEYVAGEALDIAIRHYSPASVDKALPFIAQLAGAVDFARTAGIGHGTLHPRDIFLTPDEARATGFGVANALEAIGVRAPVRRPYSAPERVAGGAWGAAADVFALGAIAWELLTGRRITGTASGSELPGDARGLPEGVRRLLSGPLARALAEDPAARYPSALAFARALEAAAEGEEERDIQVAVPPARLEKARAETKPPARAVQPSLVEAIEEDDEKAASVQATKTKERAPKEAEATTEPADDLVRIDLKEPPEPLEQFDQIEPLRPLERTEPLETEEPLDRFEPVEPVERPEHLAAVPTATSGPILFADDRSSGVPLGGVDRSRPSMLPLTLVLVAGLLVGFVAGYAVGTRGQANGTNASVNPARARSSDQPEPAVPAAAATSSAQPSSSSSPREWSEEKVPETPPPALAPTAPAPPAPPAASAPAPERGTIVVRSRPERAGVIVDGEWRGRTPLTLSDVPFGRHTVRIVERGYVARTVPVALSARQTRGDVAVALVPAKPPAPRAAPSTAPAPGTPAPQPGAETPPTAALTGSLFVDSRPPGASVFVDGRAVGKTPLQMDVAIGSHVVRLELAGHRTWSRAARVVAGSTERVTGSLEPVP